MKIGEICPAPNERLFIAGATGSGKTELMRACLRTIRREPIIIFDTKPEFEARHWWDPRRLRMRERRNADPLAEAIFLPKGVPLKSLTPGVYVFRPEYPEYGDPRVTPILLAALKRGNCTLVIDELGDFSRGGYVHPALGKVIRQGRKKRVRMLIGSQRPAGIPLIAITEANKVCCFFLMSDDDRKRMAKYVNAAMMQIPQTEFGFWFAKRGRYEARQLELPADVVTGKRREKNRNAATSEAGRGGGDEPLLSENGARGA